MENLDRFRPGDHVRIDPEYWDADLAGRTGVVSTYPDGVPANEGCVWVEVDVKQWQPGVVVGAEIDAASLRRL